MNSEEFNLSDTLCKADVEELLRPEAWLDPEGNNVDLVDYVTRDENNTEFYSRDYDLYEENKNFLFSSAQPATVNISNEEYAGPHEFEVSIIPNNGSNKNPWEYSPKLNKIYVDMGNAIPVNFNIKNPPDSVRLYVRATPKFSQLNYQQEGVYRCINHEHKNDPSNKDLPAQVWQHIIRCHNPNAFYLGEKAKNDRLSVMVPLSAPQAGTDSVTEMYSFVCKSSCPGGMNRRPIVIIFTLEDDYAHILGRRAISVRICSCPKRDKGKEEQEIDKNKAVPVPHGKKRKIEEKTKTAPPSSVQDTKEYTVKVVGKQNYQRVLKIVHDMMSAEILECIENNKGGDTTPFRNCLNETKTKISDS